eukprot:8467538-Pyramimonas_sp.AAC.1
MGGLMGKTLYRLMERTVDDTCRLHCFDRRVRLSVFAGGPKKFANLVLGRPLLSDVARPGEVAMRNWNETMCKVTDRILKIVRDDNNKVLLEWLGPNFRESSLSLDEFVFIFCEIMGMTHYFFNARKKSLRSGRGREGRRVVNIGGYMSDGSSEADSECDMASGSDEDSASEGS